MGSRAYSATAGRPGSGEVDGGGKLLLLLLLPAPPLPACPRAMAATSRNVTTKLRASPRWARMRVQGGRRAAKAADAASAAGVEVSSSDEEGERAGLDQEEEASELSSAGGGGMSPGGGGAAAATSATPMFFCVNKISSQRRACFSFSLHLSIVGNPVRCAPSESFTLHR